MKQNFFKLYVLVFCLSLYGTANATPINVTANRFVEVDDNIISVPVQGPNSPAVTLGVFNDSVSATVGQRGNTQLASADQNTDIQAGAGQLSGSGNANVDFSVLVDDDVFATSFFDVFFDITVDHTFTLSGNLSANMDGGEGKASFSLLGPTNINFSALNFGNQSLASSGILSAGSYQLTVLAQISRGQQASGWMGGHTDFNFNFGMQAIPSTVPEPTTLALLLFGLFGLGFNKRKKH